MVQPQPRPLPADRTVRDHAPAAPPVILVAEDEESLRGMVAIVLRGGGYEVLLCANGADARAALQDEQRIDLALFDLRMPVVTGSELIAIARGLPHRRGLPVIAMSAYNDEVQARELLSVGADAFLSKPFSIHELTATVAALLGRA